MTQEQQVQIGDSDKCYVLILAGGMGARIIQTAFIRSLIKKRRADKNNFPIVVIDNTLIGLMVSEALKGQNVLGVQVPECSGAAWPQDPGMMTIEENRIEHPIFVDSWRQNFRQYALQQGSVHDLIEYNWKRAYSIEYSFSLSKSIHLNKLNNNQKSFIGYLYSKYMDLDFDGGLPMMKRTQEVSELTQFIGSLRKPYIVLMLGMDRNPQEFMSAVNYRVHKVWSIQRWQEIVNALKDKYEFVQVYANQYNPELENVRAVKVDNLNPVLQLLENPKCKFFMSTDNYLPHLAATIKKRGIVLWGSVSPYVWGWKHNINIWNRSSCEEIACWRPGMFDTDQNGKTWVCDHYSCMKSIKSDQVLKSVTKLEKELDKDREQGVLKL